jgi:hypothetical protein
VSGTVVVVEIMGVSAGAEAKAGEPGLLVSPELRLK